MHNTLKLPINELGRDFVIGDLHGCYEQLKDQMNMVSFDFDKDRLFSVGDLCDRGPASEECLSLLRLPWFHATRGNHEDMLLSFLTKKSNTVTQPYDLIRNGGQWINNVSPCMRDEIQYLVEQMPIIIETPDFFVTHARMSDEPDVHEFVWDREFYYQTEDLRQEVEYRESKTPIWQLHPYNGAKLTYVGHNPTIGPPILIANHIMMDTGAVFTSSGGKLTMFQPKNVVKWLK